MKCRFALKSVLALIVLDQHKVFVQGSSLRTGKEARDLQTIYCGCNDCLGSAWDLPVSDYSGDYTCGERITWYQGYHSVSEEEACIALASDQFPAECGKSCNPRRCDGRYEPYYVQDDPPILSGDLSATADLYCFPPYESRQRWTDVWSNNFIMEVKEGRCDPGGNYFAANAVSFDSEELKLEFKNEGGQWRGAEVRLNLPADGIFHYGEYEWSVKSVKIIDTTDGSVVSQTLPPRIVLGLFTWDTTEVFGEREKNHEVDIEISNFGDVGGPDVNFLVQPPGKPQQAKIYSGGPGSYNQGGHTYKFDWEPSGITWSSTAAGGISHQYTNDVITDYFSPPWLQCLPADIEIRMNLWSLDGVNAQAGLKDHEKIEVVIDDFHYAPSGQTHVADGGSCCKHCHCSPTSTCDSGTCRSTTTATTSTTTAATTTTTAATTIATSTTTTTKAATTTTTTPATEGSYRPATCSAHPDCAARKLAGDCCPTMTGTFLYCCSQSDVSPSTAEPPTDSVQPASCAAHEQCRSLAGDCCPTSTGAFLYCCDNY